MWNWDSKTNYYNWNAERLDTWSQGLNLVEWISNLMATKVVGRGYHFSSENARIKSAIKKIEETTDIFSLLYEDVKQKSVFGFSSILVNVNELNQPIIQIGLPYNQTQIAKTSWETEGGVMYSRQGISGSSNVNIKSTADRYIIKNEMIGSQNEQMMAWDHKIFPSVKNKLKRVYYHNLGVSPLFLNQNKPKRNNYAGLIGEYYPDLVPGTGLQERYNNILKNFMKEVELNRTRIVLGISPQELGKIITSLGQCNMNDPVAQYNFYTGKGISTYNYHSDLLLTNNAGNDQSPVVMQGNPVIESYISGLEYIKDQALIAAGLSRKDDVSTVKTEAEIYFHKSDEVETVMLKKTFYQKQWKKIFDVALMMLGITKEELEDYTFEFKDNLFIDRGQETNNQQLMISMGISSPVRAYMKINNVAHNEALQALRDIREENNEFMDPLEKIVQSMNEQEKTMENNELHSNKGDNNGKRNNQNV